MRRLAVDGMEVDALLRAAEARQQAGHDGEPRVRNGDAVADARRAEPLALGQGAREPGALDARPGRDGRAQLGQHFLAGAAGELDDRLRPQDVGQVQSFTKSAMLMRLSVLERSGYQPGTKESGVPVVTWEPLAVVLAPGGVMPLGPAK